MGVIVGIITIILVIIGIVQWKKEHRSLSKILFSLALLSLIILAWMIVSVIDENRRFKEMRSNNPTQNIKTNPQPGITKKTKDQACLDSGGTVSSSSCCGQTQDFPNNCAIGACGCSPASSHQVKVCQCGTGECFDGNSCVQSSQPRGGDGVGSGSRGGAKPCSMEAKVCPDGTSVGKTGPNCEFAPCP
jgi:hypothetical protein